MLPLAALGDAEGLHLPPGLPPVIDSHVHLFPEAVFRAVWRWFEKYGWPIRYKLESRAVLDFLFSRGIERVVALHYAHKPGLARSLNRFAAEISASDSRVIALATVFPGEPDADKILTEAFASGLRGVKIHCHVSCVSPDSPDMNIVYEACARTGLPLVMHAGREPSSPHYRCDPHQLCSAERIANVLKNHPRLKLVVPHLGADEYDAYGKLLQRCDNLWLDTTMALADYLPAPAPLKLLRLRPERVLYGTDFPNLPYAWDRELKKIMALKLPEGDLAALLGGNARALFGN